MDEDDRVSCVARNLCSENNGGCSHECYTTYGETFCMCPAGYKLQDDYKTCEDIDECRTKASVRDECDGLDYCENTPGSYRCLEHIVDVVDVRSHEYCDEGYEFDGDSDVCVDIDECRTMASVRDECGGSDYCENTPGSYRCLEHIVDAVDVRSHEYCDEGYEFDGDSDICVDIDECEADEWKCGRSGKCVNLEPGFKCECGNGFAFDGSTCRDINECHEDEGRCGEGGECFNVDGGFECDCYTGYKLDDAGKVCVDIDECQDNCVTNGECVNFSGGFECVCAAGYELSEDGLNCVDINECSKGQKNPCGRRVKCVNTPGSFQCQCRAQNRVYDPDQKRCKRIQTNPCANHPCGSSSKCVPSKETRSGFYCSCQTGFEYRDGECRDLDECAKGIHDCEHYCENSPGSFRSEIGTGERVGRKPPPPTCEL